MDVEPEAAFRDDQKPKEKNMKKIIKRLGTGVAAMALMFVMGNSARASLVAIGGPVGDWSQEFVESGVGPSFIEMDFVMLSGSTFSIPGTTLVSATKGGVNVAGWASEVNTPTVASIGGPNIDTLYLDMNWTTASDVPLSFAFSTYDDYGNIVDSGIASWDGGGWAIGPAVVPEPTTIISGVLMLLPFGASTLRILRRRQVA